MGVPDPDTLEWVVASALFTIRNRVENKGWGDQRPDYPSPLLPLFEARPDLNRALYPGAAQEIAVPASCRPSTFDSPMPDAHVYILNDQRMLDAFTSVGAVPRLFGDKPMIPGVNILRPEIGLAA